MTLNPLTIRDDDMLEAVVEMNERHHIKRFPVTCGGRMVGIVSRANLMHAVATYAPHLSDSLGGDSAIRANILTAFAKQDWAPGINVIVKDGVAELYGVIADERERRGLVVAAENVAGVKKVRDHLVWVESMSGVALPPIENETMEAP